MIPQDQTHQNLHNKPYNIAPAGSSFTLLQSSPHITLHKVTDPPYQQSSRYIPSVQQPPYSLPLPKATLFPVTNQVIHPAVQRRLQPPSCRPVVLIRDTTNCQPPANGLRYLTTPQPLAPQPLAQPLPTYALMHSQPERQIPTQPQQRREPSFQLFPVNGTHAANQRREETIQSHPGPLTLAPIPKRPSYSLVPEEPPAPPEVKEEQPEDLTLVSEEDVKCIT